jgi:hypothetical protein
MAKPITEDKKSMARAMIEAGSSYRQAAEVLEISSGSVYNIMRTTHEDLNPIVSSVKLEFANKFYLLSDYIVSRISDLDIGRASLKEKAIAAAILADKADKLSRRESPAIEGKGENKPFSKFGIKD